MRTLVLGLIALVGVAAMSGSASARDRQSRYMRWNDGSSNYSQQQVQYAQPQQQNYYQEQRPNLFQQMWDMEQRKNAWLRQTFFGR